MISRKLISTAALLYFAGLTNSFSIFHERMKQKKRMLLLAEQVDGGDESAGTEADSKDLRSEGRKHDMTDRFKYKVNALMGTYDPVGEDDERQDGNILQAVGRTDGDETLVEEYIDAVKAVVKSTADDNSATWEVLPRGKKFTKIQCEVEVQSTTMISLIQEEISKLEQTVMNF